MPRSNRVPHGSSESASALVVATALAACLPRPDASESDEAGTTTLTGTTGEGPTIDDDASSSAPTRLPCSTPHCDCPLYHHDADGDGFGTMSEVERTCTPAPGWVLDATDCYDGNTVAFPGSVGTWPVDRGDGSFDYDCDGLETPYFDQLGRCDDFPWCRPSPIDGQGWVDEIPACGETALFMGDCDYQMSVCNPESGPMTQHCS